MSEGTYSVYRHTTPNGKVYIGITGQNPEKRWNRGNGYRANKHFWNAIKRYGWDNIRHEILHCGITKEEACLHEIELIAKHKSNNSDFGYNNSDGGEKPSNGSKRTDSEKRHLSEIFKGRVISEETRKRMSESAKNRNPETRRRKQTEETRRKLSEAHKGLKIADETKRKLSIANSYERNASARSVEQYTLSGEYVATYSCIKEAAEKTGASRTHISSVCSGRRRRSGGFVWKYAKAV